jgi:ribosomal protein S18 acetylase RimI-like enzyme
MEAAEAKFVELACIAITLEVAVDNHGAQTFYERMGYEQTGRIPGYYADNTDALVMRKPLLIVR